MVRVVHDAEGGQRCADDEPEQAEDDSDRTRVGEDQHRPGDDGQGKGDRRLGVEHHGALDAGAATGEVLLDFTARVLDERSAVVERELRCGCRHDRPPSMTE